MSKIREAFKTKKILIPFITCGDPNLETTKDIIFAMQRAGVGMIELGIPFSDPTAEGVVIQNANERALIHNITTDDVFRMMEEIKNEVHIPLLIMTYANVVFSYGIEKFLARGKEVGLQGLILPDVPFEEKEEFENICKEFEIDFISLIAPTSKERIQTIAKEADGFLYCVSSLGVTGVRKEITTNLDEMISLVKKENNIPCAVGFGISTLEQVKRVKDVADGVIIGSAIVKMCEENKEKCVPVIENFVKSIVEELEK
ncbi:MAG: tryptophan synthase subunit alpha [Lachnospiraceae bacterium]